MSTNPKTQKNMQNAQNNFTVKNLVDKYHNYVKEHCSYTEVYFEEVGVEKVPLTYGSEDLLTSIYTTITGKSADSRILEALSSYAKEYKEKYSNVLTEKEYAFLCENFAEVCEICFQYLENNEVDIREESVYTSEEIEILREILNPQPGSTIFVANSRLCNNANVFPKCRYKGYSFGSDKITDHDRQSWALAQIRFLSMGIESNILPGKNGCWEDEYVSDVDYVIWKNTHSESFEEAKTLFQKLNPKAKMFFFMDKRDAAGKDGESLELRKELVNSHAIRYLISYEEKVYRFFNNKKIFILADKSRSEKVRVINLVKDVSKKINSDTLDYEILWPGFYFVEKPENGIPLSDLAKLVSNNILKDVDRRITKFEKGSGHVLLEETKTMPVVSFTDLVKDYKDANLCVKELKPACDPACENWRGSMWSLKEPCVLLHGTNDTYVLGYIKEIPMSGICTVYFNKCLIPQNGIDVRYIAALLLTTDVKKQIVSVCDYDMFGSINSTILEKIIVPNHTDKERLAFLAEANYEALNSLRKEMVSSYDATIDAMKSDYINEVRMRKHDMGQKVFDLINTEDLMRYYVENRETESDVWSQIQEQLNHFRSTIHELSEMLDYLSQEERFGTPELLDLNDYLANLQHSNNVNGFTLSYLLDRDSIINLQLSLMKDKDIKDISSVKVTPTIYMAKNDLHRVVTNILSNAQKHGFVDSNRKDYEVNIRLEFNAEKGMYQIDFRNNGKPLPEGLNKMRYGIKGEKAGQTAGTGLGGSVVKSIVEHYQGAYDVFMDGDWTVIRVYLPTAI